MESRRGQLFFFLFIINIEKIMLKPKPRIYANDTIIYSQGSTLSHTVDSSCRHSLEYPTRVPSILFFCSSFMKYLSENTKAESFCLPGKVQRVPLHELDLVFELNLPLTKLTDLFYFILMFDVTLSWCIFLARWPLKNRYLSQRLNK